jgi:hypothetical protein
MGGPPRAALPPDSLWPKRSPATGCRDAGTAAQHAQHPQNAPRGLLPDEAVRLLHLDLAILVPVDGSRAVEIGDGLLDSLLELGQRFLDRRPRLDERLITEVVDGVVQFREGALDGIGQVGGLVTHLGE